jgi:hypothetical protein
MPLPATSSSESSAPSTPAENGAKTAARLFAKSKPWSALKPCHTLDVRMPWWDSPHRREFEYVHVLAGDAAAGCGPGLMAYKTLADVFNNPGSHPETFCLQLDDGGEGEPSFILWCGADCAASRPPTDGEYQWMEAALRAVVAVLPDVKVLEGVPASCTKCPGVHEIAPIAATLPVHPSFAVTHVPHHVGNATTLEVMLRYPINNWPYYRCYVCRMPSNIMCPGCGTICYCTPAHMKQDAEGWHAAQCAAMKEQQDRLAALRDHPFPFAHEIGPLVDEFTLTAKDFLESRGLYGRGIWKRTWGCFDHVQVPFGLLGDDPDATDWCLPAEECPPSHPVSSAADAKRIVDWGSYYGARGIAFTSPVALILHFPLTVLHVLRLLEARGRVRLNPGDEVRLHLIGVAQELDQRHAFRELAHCLPGVTLRLAFVGHQIDPACHGKTHNLGALSILAYSGVYTDFVPEGCCGLTDPHAVIALNCGLGAYPEWTPTCKLLLDPQAPAPRVPAFFTDYCEASCEVGRQLLEETLAAPLAYPVTMNPFRCPLSRRQRGLFTAYPEYGNGFLFAINL